MTPLSPDTHPAVEKVWLDLLRQASPARRFHLARSLTASSIWLARQALQRARPSASARDLEVEFVRLNYSGDLADRLAAYLGDRDAREAP